MTVRPAFLYDDGHGRAVKLIRDDLPAEVYAELRREGFVELRDEEAANDEDARWAAERDAGWMPSDG